MKYTRGRSKKKWFVQCRDLQPGVECRAHGRVHLILEEHGVAHQHGVAVMGWRERRPGGQSHEGRHGHAVHLDGDIVARLRHLEDVLPLGEAALQAGDLFDASGIQGGSLRGRRRVGDGTDADGCSQGKSNRCSQSHFILQGLGGGRGNASVS